MGQPDPQENPPLQRLLAVWETALMRGDLNLALECELQMARYGWAPPTKGAPAVVETTEAPVLPEDTSAQRPPRNARR